MFFLLGVSLSKYEWLRHRHAETLRRLHICTIHGIDNSIPKTEVMMPKSYFLSLGSLLGQYRSDTVSLRDVMTCLFNSLSPEFKSRPFSLSKATISYVTISISHP